MKTISAYLDTCIVSGIAKEDLKPDQQEAILKVLERRKNGEVTMVTSKIAKTEIDKIPEEYRFKHQAIYLLLADVPVCRNATIYGGGPMGMKMGMGMGAGTRVLDPIYKALRNLLPDEQDANHIFQASKNKIQYFITSDEKTILIHKEKIFEISDVKAINPVEFYDVINGQK